MLSRLLARSAEATPDAIALDRVLDSLDSAILVVNEHGQILAANHGWHAWHDESSSSLFHEHLHPGDRALWQQALLSHESPVQVRLLTARNTSLWCELKHRPINPAAPWPISLTLTDISDQVSRKRQRDADWRSLIQLVSELPAMLYRGRNNRDWTMEFVSAGSLELTGYPPEVLTNQSCLNYGDLIHPEDAGPVWEQVQEALSRGERFELHYRLQHADGQLIPVIEKGQGIYADNGAILGVEGMVLTFSTPSEHTRM